MDLRVKETDLFGRFYLKLEASQNVIFGNYFKAVDVLRVFLEKEAWNKHVTGYYINISEDSESVRISYFSPEPEKVKAPLMEFCARHGIIESQSPELPHRAAIAGIYGGEELRFRRFLHVYTLIALDIMKADLAHSRCLMAAYRWQVMAGRRPSKPHFEYTFKKHSPYYNRLSDEQKNQLWRDLDNWPDLRQVDWAHMMVNMVLPGDWLDDWKYFSTPKDPLSISDVNLKLADLGFQIPLDWRAAP